MCEFWGEFAPSPRPCEAPFRAAGVVTDAQLGLPHGWTERDRARARATTVLIPENGERLSDQERLAKQLAQSDFPVDLRLHASVIPACFRSRRTRHAAPATR